MLDMHAHLPSPAQEDGAKETEIHRAAVKSEALREMKFILEHGISTCISCGTPGEWKFCRQTGSELTAQRPDGQKRGIYLSFAVHPWYSDCFCPEDYMDCFQACDVVGEAGMDSVWCGVPLDVQKSVFERQLRIAADLKKPVILHTKGMEAQIADMVRDFPGKICVHWYSGDIRTFEKFLELGCWFTLGPDLSRICRNAENGSERVGDSDRASEKLYRYMIENIPAQKLFVETDGLSAVAWAYDVSRFELENLPGILQNNLKFVSDVKGIPAEMMQQMVFENLESFLS